MSPASKPGQIVKSGIGIGPLWILEAERMS